MQSQSSRNELSNFEKIFNIFFAIYANFSHYNLFEDNFYNFFKLVKDRDGCTAVHLALECEDFRIFKLLLCNSARLSISNNQKQTGKQLLKELQETVEKPWSKISEDSTTCAAFFEQ